MARYKLTIEYDGTPFVGWQVQSNGPSVEARLIEAGRAFAGHEVSLYGAGRTDAGVHALGQVAHADFERQWPAATVRDALNHHLKPDPIAVIACEAVPDDFHARYSATARHYLYRIATRRAPLAIERDRAWRVPVPLDAEAMHDAAQVLVGRHDFTTFRSVHCQAKSPLKTLDRLAVSGRGERIEIEASARSFMHHQVRSMVGSLKLVGEGKWSRTDLAQALAACDRAACGPVAPAAGLYLVGVDY